MAVTNPLFDGLPRNARSRICFEPFLPRCQFVFLPLVNGNRFGGGCQIVPEIFDQLKFLCWRQIKNGPRYVHDLRTRQGHGVKGHVPDRLTNPSGVAKRMARAGKTGDKT